MLAKDIMTTSVETVGPETTVPEIAKRLLARHISAVPVVDDGGNVVGIVSEGDLMHRPENETERRPSWWLDIFAADGARARDYVKSHGLHAREIMSRDVISVSDDATLEEIATILEKNRIKRVPVMREGKLVGIVSRANLLRGLAAAGTKTMASTSDRDIKAAIEKNVRDAGVDMEFASIVVADGVANIWGLVATGAEKSAMRVAAENASGVKSVNDQVNVMSDMLRSTIRAN